MKQRGQLKDYRGKWQEHKIWQMEIKYLFIGLIALNLFGDDKLSHQAAGDFLYITATQKGKLDNREQIKAKREVDNVVEGYYDQQQKRGLSMRR